jgi:hypothetical protein
MCEAKPLLTPMSTMTALDTDEKREVSGLEGVQKHDLVTLVHDGNKVKHTLGRVSVQSFLGFIVHLSSLSSEEDHGVPSFHSKV